LLEMASLARRFNSSISLVISSGVVGVALRTSEWMLPGKPLEGKIMIRCVVIVIGVRFGWYGGL